MTLVSGGIVCPLCLTQDQPPFTPTAPRYPHHPPLSLPVTHATTLRGRRRPGAHFCPKKPGALLHSDLQDSGISPERAGQRDTF